MIILGISDNHDSGVSLVRDSQILSAINEERLSRKKLIAGFPYLSVERVLSESGLTPQDIDCIVLASYMTPSFLLRFLENSCAILKERTEKTSSFSYLLNLYIIYQVLAYRLNLPQLIEKYLSIGIIKRRLAELNIKAPVFCIDHHYAHATCAYYTSDFNSDTLIITIDGMGDALSVTVNIGRGNTVKRIFSQTSFSSISTYYSRLTEYLGFKPVRHEGKITSLAGYGNFNEAITELANTRFHFIEKKRAFNLENHFIKESNNSGFYKRLNRYSKQDVAYNFQKNFEEEILKFIEFWVKKTGISNLGLSGGAFANVSLNRRINQLGPVKNLYIFPHMGDGGLSLGAVFAFLRPAPFYLKNIYLGPGYDNKHIAELLETSGLNYCFMQEDDLCNKIANILSEGKVVAHFNAKMEYGPRALGNRSILYSADDPTCQDWLNDKLKRTVTMPFAPVTLDSEAGSLYLDTNKTSYTLRFMNIAVDCTKEMKEKCPGAVHIDGTARPQIVYQEDNPRLYGILKTYQGLKGTSTVINTSFNKHEEPIVCSPEDAIKSFLECDLDYLVLNNFLVCRKSI